MLRCTISGTLYRPPLTEEGEVPLPGERRSFREPLTVDGSEDDPDEFDIQERIPAEFAGESPQHGGRRARKLERAIATAAGFAIVSEAESKTDPEGDLDADAEGGSVEVTVEEIEGAESESEAEAEAEGDTESEAENENDIEGAEA